jgi:plastocyanin
MIRTVAALLLVATIGGCSKPPGPPPSAAAAPSAPAAAATANAAQGQVAGKVHASGTAVVVLEPKTARTFAPQTDKPVMDQAGLTFGPDLLLVRTGQPVEFRNSDDTLHNVHVTHEETRTPAFNVAIPTGNSYNYTFDLDGFYRVGCDIHPAMSASVFAATTPYTVVAESDGRFTFSDVPTGAWTVTVYTGGKRLRKDIEVKGGLTDVTID